MDTSVLTRIPCAGGRLRLRHCTVSFSPGGVHIYVIYIYIFFLIVTDTTSGRDKKGRSKKKIAGQLCKSEITCAEIIPAAASIIPSTSCVLLYSVYTNQDMLPLDVQQPTGRKPARPARCMDELFVMK